MVSAEEYRLVNERVPHHRVVPGVLMDAQTYEFQSRTRVQKLRQVPFAPLTHSVSRAAEERNRAQGRARAIARGVNR